MPVHRKVTGGAVGGAVGIVITWILVSAGLDVSPEVGGAISTIAGFTVGWLVPATNDGGDA